MGSQKFVTLFVWNKYVNKQQHLGLMCGIDSHATHLFRLSFATLFFGSEVQNEEIEEMRTWKKVKPIYSSHSMQNYHISFTIIQLIFLSLGIVHNHVASMLLAVMNSGSYFYQQINYAYRLQYSTRVFLWAVSVRHSVRLEVICI